MTPRDLGITVAQFNEAMREIRRIERTFLPSIPVEQARRRNRRAARGPFLRRLYDRIVYGASKRP